MPSNKKSGSFNKQREIEKKRRKRRKTNNKYINNANYNYCFISIEFSNI